MAKESNYSAIEVQIAYILPRFVHLVHASANKRAIPAPSLKSSNLAVQEGDRVDLPTLAPD